MRHFGRAGVLATTAALLPTEESVVATIGGQPFALPTIVECPATPGFGLGFGASTPDHIGDGSRGLRVNGGFERDQGLVTIVWQSQRWRAGRGVDGGSLAFELEDSRTDDGRQFVTVRGSGTAIGEAGGELPFEFTATCEPGGT